MRAIIRHLRRFSAGRCSRRGVGGLRRRPPQRTAAHHRVCLTLPLLLLVLIAPMMAAEPLTVAWQDERLSVRAERWPLAQILQEIAWQTAIEIRRVWKSSGADFRCALWGSLSIRASKNFPSISLSCGRPRLQACSGQHWYSSSVVQEPPHSKDCPRRSGHGHLGRGPWPATAHHMDGPRRCHRRKATFPTGLTAAATPRLSSLLSVARPPATRST